VEDVIQGVPGMTYKTYRGDKGGRDEQKVMWEEESLKCTPGEL